MAPSFQLSCRVPGRLRTPSAPEPEVIYHLAIPHNNTAICCIPTAKQVREHARPAQPGIRQSLLHTNVCSRWSAADADRGTPSPSRPGRWSLRWSGKLSRVGTFPMQRLAVFDPPLLACDPWIWIFLDRGRGLQLVARRHHVGRPWTGQGFVNSLLLTLT